MDSSCSAVKFNPKPVTLFYVWYTELCRRMNCIPAPIVKPAKPKCQTILDFVGDRLKVEEWNPIVNALRSDTSLHVISIKSRIGNCQFLHDVDTEEKVKRMKRRFGSLWTAYVLQQLTKSISSSLKNTIVLTYLELDGIPLSCEYLEPLLQALKKNRSVKHLSFANCSIKDTGCNLVCDCLRSAPNIEIVNLSNCQLLAQSGQYIAKLIKHQQINRYCESWHNSLRYSTPEVSGMRGIKRITLNRNPDFGDEGFDHILNELEDDLWLKALDLQRCGVTENLGMKIIDIVNYNRSLEIIDLRQNELLNLSTIEKVLQLLRDKQEFGYQPEFQWCNTALTLTLDSLRESSSSVGTANVIHKTKSAPNKNNFEKSGASTFAGCPIRKTKTLDNIPRSVPRNMISELNIKLRSEIQKRKDIEKKNEELIHQLEKVQSGAKLQSKVSNGIKQLKTIVDAVDKKPKSGLKEKKSVDETLKTSTQKEVPKVKNGFHPAIVNEDLPKIQNGFQPAVTKPLLINGAKNGFKIVNGIKKVGRSGCTDDLANHKNGFSSKTFGNACKMFENIMKRSTFVQNTNKECEELLDYFISDNNCEKQNTNNPSQVTSESHDSLYKYMDELRNNEDLEYINEKT